MGKRMKYRLTKISISPAHCPENVIKLISKRTEAETNLKLLLDSLNRDYESHMRDALAQCRIAETNIDSLSSFKSFDGMNNTNDLTLPDCSRISDVIDAAETEIHDWEDRVQKASIQSRTDAAFSAFTSSVMDADSSFDCMPQCWIELQQALEDEEIWLVDIKGTDKLPTTALQKAVDHVLNVLMKERSVLESIKSVAKKIRHRFSPQQQHSAIPTNITKLIALEDEEERLFNAFDVAQSEFNRLKYRQVHRRHRRGGDAILAARKVEECRIEYRSASKAVEKELQHLAKLTASAYPELPLLFPHADILRFSRIAEEGLSKYGVTFDPRNGGGSFGEVSVISSGRHTIYKACLDGKHYVLKELACQLRMRKVKF